MKLLIALLCFGISISVLATEDLTELDTVVCLHYKNEASDPNLSINFKHEENDFTKVTIEERFTSRFTNDTIWVKLHDESVQVATHPKRFNLDSEEVSLEVQRPIPQQNQARRTNGILDFKKGTFIHLRCEKRT